MQRNYNIIKFVFLILLLSFGQRIFAQSLSIQGELDKSEIKTGQQAAVELTIRTDNLAETSFRLSDNGEGQGFEVIALEATDTIELDNDLLEIKAHLVITSMDSTLIRIPPIIAETPTAIDSTESFALNVIQPDVDISKPNEFKGIKKPWSVSFTWRDIMEIILSSAIFWSILIVLVLSILSLLLYRWYKERQSRLAIKEETIRVLTAIEVFEQSIKLIEERNYILQGNFKIYYSLLIEALKTYLDIRLRQTTMEQTSNEVLETLSKLSYSKKELNQLEEVFRLSDLSKFAKSKPTKEEAEESMKTVRNFAHLVEKIEIEQQEELQRVEQKQ